MSSDRSSVQGVLSEWHPDASEVAAIVAEMHPIVVAFAERSKRQLADLRAGR